MAAESFPGVNGLIAFTSNRDGNDEIYFMAADGSGQTRLTTNPAVDHPYCLGSMLSSNGALTKMTSPNAGHPQTSGECVQLRERTRAVPRSHLRRRTLGTPHRRSTARTLAG